jgi:hypothetical protein
MRILVYKQTHLGDPDLWGAWWRCMGKVRLREYDAVIAIGGHGHDPQSWGIAGRVTWVGIGPHARYRVVRFEHYRNFGNAGPLVECVLKPLVLRMPRRAPIMIQDEDPFDDFVREVAGEAPASRDYDGSHPCCRMP